MHPALRQLLDQTVARFADDPHVLAAYHSGSIGTDREDEHSDVDPVFVVATEAFAEVDAELPSIFAELCARVHLWWPERGNCDTWRNYACLFDADGVLLQYDITLQVPPAAPPLPVTPEQFLFDKAGLLDVRPASPSGVGAERLLWTIERYWVYVFIHAKYLRRGDPFKLAFAQQELFQDHLEVLRVHQQIGPAWWPLVAHAAVPPTREDDMLRYFGPPTSAAVSAALSLEVNAFSRDAHAACAHHGLRYPEELEGRIRAHLGL